MRLLLAGWGCLWAASLFGFEKIALIDSYDYGHIFDTECREGTQRILDHVLKTGADTLLWRSHDGAIPCYASAYEDLDRLEMPFDRRRMPDARMMQNWMRVWAQKPDALRVVFEECAARAQVKSRGVHMLLEDAHWQFCFLGNWNLEHPQYFCRDHEGRVMMFHQSFAYPDVVRHRLDIAREILARGAETLFLDIFRNGGWMVHCEYTEPNLAEWNRLYPGEAVPVPGKASAEAWNRWVRVASRGFVDYLRGLRRLTREKGARFVVNLDRLNDEEPGWMFRSRGFDWRQAVEEDLIDALAVTGIETDEKDPFGMIERRFGRVAKVVKAAGKRVYFPILAYNFPKRPSFGQVAKWTKMSDVDCVRRLLAIAARNGADGIVMECVDHGNYSENVCKAIREFSVSEPLYSVRP